MNHPQESAENAGWISVGCNGIEGSNTAAGTNKEPRSRVGLFLPSLGSAGVCSPGSVCFWKYSDDEAESELIVSWAFYHACVDIAAVTFYFKGNRVTTHL